ncbi:MAG: hypothetical protein ACREIC_17760, partial [Limisphaerales bacterium]
CLDKWLPVTWMLVNDKNGISSREIHRTMGVTQKTAWFMFQRVRLAMQCSTRGKLCGKVGVDETFIGGKARNMRGAARKFMAVALLARLLSPQIKQRQSKCLKLGPARAFQQVLRGSARLLAVVLQKYEASHAKGRSG